MANIEIGWQNFADIATLSGGSWVSTLPLANLQTRFRSEVARSTNVLTTSTKIAVDFGSASKVVRWVILDKHNMSTAATVRVKGGTTAGAADVADTGSLEVWQATPTRDLRYEDANWWTGTLSAADVEGYPISMFIDLAANVKARYWTIEITDTANSAGYVQIARLWMGPFWSPQRNVTWGTKLGWEDPSREQRTDSGVMYFAERQRFRVYHFNFPAVTDDEAFGTLLDMQRIAGKTREVVVIPDKEDLVRGFRRNIVGHLRQTDMLEQIQFGWQTAGYVLEERI